MAQQGQVNFVVTARDAASKVLKNIQGSIKSMAKTFLAIGAAASAAVAGITKYAKAAVGAAIADQAANERMISVLKARGLATEDNLALIEKQIGLNQKLGFTDDQTRSSIQTATQFTKKFTDALEVSNVARDLAAAKNMSLDRATMLVGRAYAGQGGALRRLGIDLSKVGNAQDFKTKKDKDGNLVMAKSGKALTGYIGGMKALTKITSSYGGVAEKMSKTTETRIHVLKDTFSELQESVGYAIGGGNDLPFFTEILDAVQPFVEQVSQTVKDNLPTITSYSRELKDKIIANLPKMAAWLKINLPLMLTKGKELVNTVKDGVLWLIDALSSTGPVNAAIVALGAKFGGWKGAIGGVFTAAFSSLKLDPITSAVAGAIAGGITGSIVEIAIQSFTKKIVASLTGAKIAEKVLGGATSVIPAGVTGGPAMAQAATAGGISTAGLGSMIAAGLGVGAVIAAAVGVSKLIYDALYTSAEQKKNQEANYAKTQAAIANVGAEAATTAAGGTYGGGGYTGVGKNSPYSYLGSQSTMETPKAEVKNTVIISAKALTSTINTTLGIQYRVAGLTRNGGR
jgi:hypothetical protein